VFECLLTPEDFLFFVSREFNTFTSMLPVIHNYALTYALGKTFNIVAATSEPHYEELDSYDNYATPALPVTSPRFVTHTYNSVCSRTNTTQSSLNVPSLGRNTKMSPRSAEFEFLVFSRGGEIPRYLRIGKKSCISSIKASQLEIISVDLHPDEAIDTRVCFNLLDLSPNDIVESADVILMYPSPVAKSMRVRSPYLKLRGKGLEFCVPIPRHLRGAFE